MDKLRNLSLVLLASCVRLPHVDPAPREPAAGASSAVIVESSCDASGESPWSNTKIASGGIISGRHVLTADHVVACPTLPDVHVTLPDGRRFMMVVTRESTAQDIARLEVFSAENFQDLVVPPTLGVPQYNDMLCEVTAFPRREERCGPSVGKDLFRVQSFMGNSGSFVYDRAGDLVGIEIASGQAVLDGSLYITQYAEVDASWLEGT